MNCAVHPDAPAVGYCRNCGKAMCAACVRPVRDVLYCEDCLAMIMGLPPARVAPPLPMQVIAPATPPDWMASSSSLSNSAQIVPSGDPLATPFAPVTPGTQLPMLTPAPTTRKGSASPALAFGLGFVPGLGAIYNGEYNKALIHILVFAGLIVGLSSNMGAGLEVTMALLLAGFVFYMPFDAMRSARARLSGEVAPDPIELWSKNRPVGPMILIAIGGFFLLKNFGLLDFFRLGDFFWPVILIGVGVLLLRQRLSER